MKKSELRQIIKEEIENLNESKKWYEYDSSIAKLKSNIMNKWDDKFVIQNDLLQFLGVYYTSTGDYEDVLGALENVVKVIKKNPPK